MQKMKCIGLIIAFCLLTAACNSLTPTSSPEPDSDLAEPPAQEETVLQMPIPVEQEEPESAYTQEAAVETLPHPFAAALLEYFTDSEEVNNLVPGELKAFRVVVDEYGTESILAIRHEYPTEHGIIAFPMGRIFYMIGGELHYKDIGSAVGNGEHGSRAAVTAEGNRLIKAIYDFDDSGISGSRSYTLFNMIDGGLSEDFTIFHTRSAPDDYDYFLMLGGRDGETGWWTNWDTRQAITQEEFYVIRTRYGLENVLGVWDMEDETNYILAMTIPAAS